MQASKNEMKKTDKIKSACKYVYENTPKLSLVAFSLCALAFFVRLACRLFPAFADFFVRYIAGGFRFVFANVSNVVPFSLAEICKILGKSKKQVYNLMERAKTSLAKLLKKEGVIE